MNEIQPPGAYLRPTWIDSGLELRKLCPLDSCKSSVDWKYSRIPAVKYSFGQ